ncbi:MAG: acyl-CoA dehydrogenase family protein [Methylophilus sp.]|nr:acyl-CoA dehydrogenase family protein [Methylophilus sp.]
MQTQNKQKEMEARIAIIDRIGREIARPNADDVDIKARFPIETANALREAGAFIWPIPVEFGGLGVDSYELAKQCAVLGQYDASAAAALAMHHTQILSAVHHANGNPALQDYMRRVAKENRIIASVTSEVGPGGNMRNSQCAVERQGDRYTLTKKATTVSYGSYADDLMITARKDSTAAAGDQVLVIAERGNFELKDKGVWDTLGMRGTCSEPATVVAHGEAWQVMEVPFADIATYTMVPTSHLFWAACWYGVATDAVNKSRELLRLKARSMPGTTPMGAHRVADLDAELQSMEHEVFGMAREYADAIAQNDNEKLGGLAFAKRINALKLNCSKKVIAIVTEAMATIGIQAYKNNSPFSLSRQLRDAHSAVMQVHNDRIQQTNASILLVHKGA